MTPSSPNEARLSVLRTAVLGLSVVLSTAVSASAFRDFLGAKYVHRTLRVTGAATRTVQSDLAIWHAQVRVDCPTPEAGYPELTRATEAVRAHLRSAGATPEELDFASIDTMPRTEVIYERDVQGNVLSETNRITGYALVRRITVTSSDLPKVERIANGFTDLLGRGFQVESEPVEYLFTGMAGLKVELVEAATRDARGRAERVARASRAELGTLERADVGVVQVNAHNESVTTWEGVYDRSAEQKDVMVTVRTVFALR